MKEMTEEERKKEEMEFHNKREADRNSMSEEAFLDKYSNKKFYDITADSKGYISDWIKENVKGKTALDYCCGLGHSSLIFAENGAFVYGIDISDESVATAEKRLIENGYGEKSKFQVMDAEKMTFEDSTFDVIICNGVLHHLDIELAYPELARVLKPSGRILCIEALGHNPIIQLYRKLTPHLRTSWEAEHILSIPMINQAKKQFNTVERKHFHLFSIGALIFHGTFLFKPVLFVTNLLDKIFLKIPLVNRMSWQVIFELSNKK